MRTLGALLASTILLSGCGGTTTTVTAPASTTPLGRPIGSGTPPQEAGDPAARAAARTFFTSYLAVSYGRADAASLRGASAALRDRLRSQQARVPQGVKARTPRVAALRLEPIDTGLVRATATVGDGDVAPYPLFATLRRSHGRWTAVSVGG